MCADEESLSKGLLNCYDSWMAASFDDEILIALGYKPYQWTVFDACWGADCITLKAVSKLHVDSYCLRYVPEAVRKGFLEFIARCVAQEASERAAAQGEHAAFYCSVIADNVFCTAVCCSEQTLSLNLVVTISFH
jgi:hypothetical protein